MKLTQIFKMTLVTLSLALSTASFAQSCYLEADGSVSVKDLSIQSKKLLWNSCIDKKLARLDARNPQFEALGQQIGDTCVNSNIICQ
jgi:hypothetical protein